MRTRSEGERMEMHPKWRWLGLALAAGAIASTAMAAKPSHLYVPIDVPGATYTQAFGINERGDVVGMWRDASNVLRGFVLRDGAFDVVEYPGAILTQVRAINSQGEIIGSYRLPGEPAVAFHGFFRGLDGVLAPLDYPDAPYTIPQRILADGTVVGCYHGVNMTSTMFGFVRASNGDLDTFAVPASMHNGATPGAELIVGFYTDLTTLKNHGYVVQEGAVQSFLVPGSAWTEAWDINRSGEIVGNFGGATLGTMRGYLLRDGEFKILHVPGAVATFAFGVNSWGAVVGRYVDGVGGSHGFLAVPRPPRSIDRHPSAE